MLHVSDLHVGYGAIAALRGASLEVKEGEVVALIGGNGAGKSTLLRTISGILTPSRGDVIFEGRSLRGMAEDRIVRLGILQVQEGRGILTRMTVQENLEMGAYRRSDNAEIRHDMEMIFDKFPILLVEQNARKALQCADRGYVLETGNIVLTGSGEALLKSEEVQAAYLGGRA